MYKYNLEYLETEMCRYEKNPGRDPIIHILKYNSFNTENFRNIPQWSGGNFQ